MQGSVAGGIAYGVGNHNIFVLIKGRLKRLNFSDGLWYINR
ncbi:TPA: hypothetical protein ACFU2V_001705 [Neisseria subflava]